MVLLAIVFPAIYFLITGNIVRSIIALFLMFTVIGWIPASIWAYRFGKDKASDNMFDYLAERERSPAMIEARAKEKLRESLVDISGVSDMVARTIIDQYPTKESIQAAIVEELTEIPGVGNSTAKAIKARIG